MKVIPMIQFKTDSMVSFIFGSLTGIGGGITLLDTTLSHLALVGFIKLFFVVAIGLASGVAGLIGKDFYNNSPLKDKVIAFSKRLKRKNK